MLAPQGLLRIGTSGDYAPFSIWDGDAHVVHENAGAASGQSHPSDQSHRKKTSAPSGFSIDVARAYASGLESTSVARTPIQWVRFRWADLTGDLASGAFDVALSGVTIRPDRSAAGRFSLPLTTSGAVALVPADSRLASRADLDQPLIRLAVNRGGHLEQVARSLFPTASIRPIEKNARVLEELMQGRADAVLTDSVEAPHWQRNAKRGLRAIGPLTSDRKAAWFSPRHEEQARRFNRWLLQAEAGGALARWRAAHDLSARQTALPVPALLATLDERLSLMSGVADAKHVLGIATENLAREDVVLDSASQQVQREAERAGVAPPRRDSIRRLFRAQIEAAKWIQRRRRAELEAAASKLPASEKSLRTEESVTTSSEGARTDLEKILRPALIYLGDRISMLLIASIETGAAPPSIDDLDHALARHQLPEAERREIGDALNRILRNER